MTRKPPSPAPGAQSQAFGPLLRQFFQAMRLATEEILSPSGHSMRQALILSALDRDPGVTSAGMAQRMMITPQAMGEMLAEMEKAGLLKRQAAKGNARKRAIFLTAGGKKALATCRGAMHQVEERMLAPLSAAERKTLNRLLGDCIAGLNK